SSSFFFFKSYGNHRDLHSFPTRRSSDLEIIEDLKEVRAKVEPPLQKLEYALNPIVSFFVLPLFALSNAGINLDVNIWDALTNNRSEEHTSELQSRENLVCRLLLEKKKKN